MSETSRALEQARADFAKAKSKLAKAMRDDAPQAVRDAAQRAVNRAVNNMVRAENAGLERARAVRTGKEGPSKSLREALRSQEIQQATNDLVLCVWAGVNEAKNEGVLEDWVSEVEDRLEYLARLAKE